ncbi:MAG: methylmalonyl-CoA mutase [Alphaproteobacteria bacterium]|nr:methylmalonyl-CoA mutase [Alphaproteobacteria bacterium]MBU1515908.1 methylmalonyl-CoA mutase [Alphaproteobacteria bacterium]MBU2094130.1 methylmalonyl-CoA mutase [Alphaproteobacteria bacterium]MBU2151482.1 methylmalonyl-CoA mutase [Alphaproteobacteria bacterium]MBU2305242.1 methylmalonyl-CoA mutase [Alphaproteobacteria bacterium]
MADAALLDPGIPLAGEDAWRALVAKTLGDKPFESLIKSTAEGLTIAPLYAASEAPVAFPPRPFDGERPWDARVLSAHPDPARVNAELLADLEGGAASVIVKGHATAEALTRALKGVIVELASVGVDAGFLGPKAADALHAVAKASPTALLAFNLDPLGAFAETGVSPGPIEAHLISAATVGARLAQTYPQAQLFLASGRVAHEAGGGEALEVAVAAASAIAYAKALVRAGLPVADAFARITLGLAADGDYFLTLAKLRAARAVFARIATASGGAAQARIEARTSRRMLTAQDPWTNMIRLSVAGFGAAAGGADAVVLGTFTDALGLPTTFGRRQSRNAQLVLMEEAAVGRVADPAAGSGYLETLTDQIARAAWDRLQAIEAAGGIIAALETGLIARDVAAAVTARGDPKILGVTAFPPTADARVEVESAKAAELDPAAARLPGPDSHGPALTPVRLSEKHEVTA